MATDWVAAVAKMRGLVGVYLAALAKGPLTAHQAAALATDLKTLDVDLAGLAAVIPTVVQTVVTGSSTFVTDFGTTPAAAFDATLAKIKAAGEYVQNADETWPSKNFADWHALFAKYGGAAAAAAYYLFTFNPLECDPADLGNVPADAVPIVNKYYCGIFIDGNNYHAWKNGVSLGVGGRGDSAWAFALDTRY